MSSQLLLHEAAGWHWWFAPFWFFLWVVVIVAIVRFSPADPGLIGWPSP